MATLTGTPARTATRTIPIGAAILALGCIALAYIDFFVTTSDGTYAYTADYVYTLDMYPLLAGLGLVVAGICARQGGSGRTGAIIVGVGLLGLAVDGIGSVVGRNDQTLGPLYPIATLITFVGMVVFTVASLRARVLPWWTTPALTLGWIVGGVVGDSGPLGFKASALLLAAAGIAIASAANRHRATEAA